MKVYYSGNFWGGHKYEHASKEISVKKEFYWGGLRWYIPAVYSCSKGLVIDFCVSIPKERIEKYIKYWNIDKRLSGLSMEEYEQMEKENPFTIDFEVEVKINGKELEHPRMCATGWHPCNVERELIEDVEEELMEYYACDRSQGWRFVRACLPWKTSRKPVLKTLSLTLKERPVAYSGDHFVTEEACVGQEIEFFHPINKKEHRITLHGYEPSTLPAASFMYKKDKQYPDAFKILTYSISPELSPEEFSIKDCAESDPPKSKPVSSSDFEKMSSGHISTIGGADGPAAIFVATKSSKDYHKYSTCSSLHFSQVSKVEWRMVFYIKENEDIYQEIIF